MRYFGDRTYNQFSSVPIRLGYQQDLLGYNAFKWERKIEPLKYEKVKKELLYNVEQMSEQATTYFFALAMAQVEYRSGQGKCRHYRHAIPDRAGTA